MVSIYVLCYYTSPTALSLLKCQVILLLSSPKIRFRFPKQTSSFLVIYSRHMAVATVALGRCKCQMSEDGRVPIVKGISQVAGLQLRYTRVSRSGTPEQRSRLHPCLLLLSLQQYVFLFYPCADNEFPV